MTPTEKRALTLAHYQLVMNRIEDYLEYRWRKDDAETVRNNVMAQIAQLGKMLRKLK